MAKCIITFEDEVNDDGESSIGINISFDPPLDNPMHGHKPTPAQNMGWSLWEAAHGKADE